MDFDNELAAIYPIFAKNSVKIDFIPDSVGGCVLNVVFNVTPENNHPYTVQTSTTLLTRSKKST